MIKWSPNKQEITTLEIESRRRRGLIPPKDTALRISLTNILCSLPVTRGTAGHKDVPETTWTKSSVYSALLQEAKPKSFYIHYDLLKWLMLGRASVFKVELNVHCGSTETETMPLLSSAGGSRETSERNRESERFSNVPTRNPFGKLKSLELEQSRDSFCVEQLFVLNSLPRSPDWIYTIAFRRYYWKTSGTVWFI